jgi:ethanolamine transporter EutH
MPFAREPDLIAIRRSVERVGRLSDNLVRLGPFRLGLDGVLSWIPGLGEIYSAAAAAFLITQGARAGVPASTLLLAAALMGGRTLITAVPLAGPAAADLLTLHRWSAHLIVRAIDRRIAAGEGGARAGRRRRGADSGFGLAAA